MELHIATEFSDVPGPRSRQEGDWSGEEFRDELLRPRFREAEKVGDKLVVDLDGGCGYATSFLNSPWQKSSRHSTVPASRRTALLWAHILPVCTRIAPGPAGAGTVSVLARLSPRAVKEAFGGLARVYSPERVLKVLEFKSTEEPYLIEDVREYIQEAITGAKGAV